MPLLRIVSLAAFVGGALVTALMIRDTGGDVFTAFETAGSGIVWASLVHFLPIAFYARAWQVLAWSGRRPSLGIFFWLALLRGAINTVLPVAKIGGELVSARLLGRMPLHKAVGQASIVVDMTLTVVGQSLFTLVGLGLLVETTTGGALVVPVAIALTATIPLILFMLFAHKMGLFGLLGRLVKAVVGDRFATLSGKSARIDQAIALCYRRKRVLLEGLVCQLLGFFAGSLEIWVATRFLHAPISLSDAVLIESLIQALGSAAFVVPGALGVQEGGFVLLGSIVGLPTETALALALMRRARDVLLFIPVLLIWQGLEGRRVVLRRRRHTAGRQSPR